MFDLPFIVQGHIVHLQPQRKGKVCVGMQFIFDNDDVQRQTLERICQFTLWLQHEHVQCQPDPM